MGIYLNPGNEGFRESVISELREIYPEYVAETASSLPLTLAEINRRTDEKFVVIIDEWDCLFREDRGDRKAQDEYIELLRGLFKGAPAQKFIRMAYMTGILPIKKYGTQSALNNFKEYTMLRPRVLAKYMGFTEEEVRKLCEKYHMDFEEAKCWYDGYSLGGVNYIYAERREKPSQYPKVSE